MVYSTRRREVAFGSSRGERWTDRGKNIGRGGGGIEGGDEWVDVECSSGRDCDDGTGDDEGLDDAEGNELTRGTGELELIFVAVGAGGLKDDGSGNDAMAKSLDLGEEEGAMDLSKGWSSFTMSGGGGGANCDCSGGSGGGTEYEEMASCRLSVSTFMPSSF